MKNSSGHERSPRRITHGITGGSRSSITHGKCGAGAIRQMDKLENRHDFARAIPLNVECSSKFERNLAPVTVDGPVSTPAEYVIGTGDLRHSGKPSLQSRNVEVPFAVITGAYKVLDEGIGDGIVRRIV